MQPLIGGSFEVEIIRNVVLFPLQFEFFFVEPEVERASDFLEVFPEFVVLLSPVLDVTEEIQLIREGSLGDFELREESATFGPILGPSLMVVHKALSDIIDVQEITGPVWMGNWGENRNTLAEVPLQLGSSPILIISIGFPVKNVVGDRNWVVKRRLVLIRRVNVVHVPLGLEIFGIVDVLRPVVSEDPSGEFGDF